MIWITGDVDGKLYKEPFSKGILSRSLNVADIGFERAYEMASEIEADLIKDDINEISSVDLAQVVFNYLKNVDPSIAKKYKNWRSLRSSKKPLIILIGGASGVGTSSMAFELANRLRLKNLISTDMIREVMRKIVSKELSPVIHKSSFDAYESIRTPSIRIDSVIEGFISHVDVVNVGIEAIIERSAKEGISTIIEGVHIVPGFIRKDLMENNNIIIFTLTVDDEESHKQRFYSRCRQPWVKRSLEKYMENFGTIRKTQKFLVEQAKIHDSRIINNVDINETIDIMVNDILEEFGGEDNVEQES
ncbi:2-phosphoglycerate kinase [uncultured Methanobrevibacter sp.]|uniref:2-phosphoglycerate kinase n=1 Tax=uncultured Methanobrevibacter sp. TaxID=253161 RepID=UPI0025E36D1E|nr:2-phosphoglycerate kinase [uncultured Methanobrevibacter sp.]